MNYHAPDRYVRELLDFLEMRIHCYDSNVKINSEPVFELIDTDGIGLGVRSYFDVVKQIEERFADYKEE